MRLGVGDGGLAVVVRDNAEHDDVVATGERSARAPGRTVEQAAPVVVTETHQAVTRLRNGAMKPEVVAQSCVDAAARADAAASIISSSGRPLSALPIV